MLQRRYGWDSHRADNVVAVATNWDELQGAKAALSSLLADGSRANRTLNNDQVVAAVRRANTARSLFFDTWHGALANADPTDYGRTDHTMEVRLHRHGIAMLSVLLHAPSPPCRPVHAIIVHRHAVPAGNGN